jgi:hypothetical protein
LLMITRNMAPCILVHIYLSLGINIAIQLHSHFPHRKEELRGS